MKDCLKQVVTATIITKSRDRIIGKNSILNQKITICPRLGMNSGEGYDLCRAVCNQQYHAEVAAIKNAQEKGCDLTGAVLYLEGHTYVCEDCWNEIIKTGIQEVIIL